MSTVRIQLRRGLSTDWTSVNPVLAAGEAGLETDSLQIKIGDGTAHWNSLDYATVTPQNLTDAINAAITGTVDVNFATISDLDTAISTAVSTAEGYTDGAISTEVTRANAAYEAAGAASAAVTTAESASNAYTDGKIATEVTNRNSAIATAVSTAEGYTDTAVSNLVNGAPAVLDTLKELSDALGADKNFSTTVANNISAITNNGTLHNATFTGTLTLPAGSITGSEIADLTIDAGHIVAGTITGSKIALDAIAGNQLQSGSVTTSKIVDQNVTTSKIADQNVTTSKIADLAITDDKISSVAMSKVVGLTSELSGLSNTYATLNNATFSGTISLPSNTSIGSTTSTELSYIHGVTSAIQTQFGTAATNLSNHTSATTNVHGIDDTAALSTKDYVNSAVSVETQARITAVSGEASARSTAVTNAISTAEGYTDSAIAAVTSINGTTIPSFKTLVTTADTGTVTSTMILDGTIVNADINASAAIATSKISGLDTALADKLASTTAATTYETITNVALKAPLASPTFTGTVNAAAVTTTGNVIVGGNLTVNGTTTTINSTTLNTTEQILVISNTNTPTDVTANGAGITIKGATDKTVKWYSSTEALTSSENIDLASGKTYKINGTDVLTATAVGGRTIPASNIVGLTDTQTLTNKTLTSPTISNPTVSGTTTYSSGGYITFADATTQSTAGVASITTIATPATTSSSFSATTYRDQFVPITGGNTYTITDSGCPIGLSVNFWQNSGTLGIIAVTGSGSASGATIVGTPGLKLRATNSVATAMKVSATQWILYGDLSA